LGATLTDPDSGIVYSLPDPRIKAGIVIAAPGNGGSDLSTFAYENYTCLRHPSFAEMKTKALVVAGDQDASPYLSKRGADWRVDPYTHSPGPKDLLILVGGEHGLGISGYDVKETTDESPQMVAVVQRMTVTWLRSALREGGEVWGEACKGLEGLGGWGVLSRSEALRAGGGCKRGYWRKAREDRAYWTITIEGRREGGDMPLTRDRF
jgi:hypothetical protein